MNKVLLFYDFCKKTCKEDAKCKEECNKTLQNFFKEITKNKSNYLNKSNNLNIYYI